MTTFLTVLALSLLPVPAPQQAGPDPEQLIEEARAQGVLHGAYLVAQGGRVLHSSACGVADVEGTVQNDVETRFQLASLSKLLTQAVAWRLVHLGKLDADALVGEYVKGLAPEVLEGVRVRHLIDMSSGLPREIGNDPRTSGVILDPEGSVLEGLSTLSQLRPQFEPGTRNQYSNVGYWILGGVIESAAERPFEQALRKYLLEPLGLSSTGLERRTEEGVHYAVGLEATGDDRRPAEVVDYSRRFTSGGLYSTVGDLFELSRALTREDLFGAEGVATLFGSSWSVRLGGRLPGFTNVFFYDRARDLCFVALNNVSSDRPELLFSLVDRLAGGEPEPARSAERPTSSEGDSDS